MANPISSNLIFHIQNAIDDCYNNGYGKNNNGNGLKVIAEWTDSKRSGYSIMCITIMENDVVKFSFDDYGTECPSN